MRKFNLSPITSAVIIIVVLVGGYFLIKHNSNNSVSVTPAPSPEPVGSTTPEKLVDTTLITEKNYNTPDTYTKFNVVYPQFKNAPADFNSKIEGLINDGIAEQKKESADNWKARYDTRTPTEKVDQYPKDADKFYYDVTYKPIQVNNHYISAYMTISGFTGGAHGYENIVSMNYDVENKTEITLADLLPSDPNYLKTVSDFSRKDLEAQFRKSLAIKTKTDEKNFQDSIVPMLMQGTTPDEMNFSVFTFTPDAITLYFAQYQVGPYSMGLSKVVFPRK